MLKQITFAAVMALSLLTGTAQAQETTLAFYLADKIGTGTIVDPFRPEYIGDLSGVQWSAMDLGIEPTFIVGANLTAEQHAFVSSQPDVFAFPVDIGAAIGGNPALSRVRNGLEQRNIPAEDVVAGWTTRQVIARIIKSCFILQRLNGRHQRRMFEPGVSLDSLPSPALLADLIDVGQSFGMTTSALSLSVSVRENLLALASQVPPVALAGQVF
jgi:hypothetical protein